MKKLFTLFSITFLAFTANAQSNVLVTNSNAPAKTLTTTPVDNTMLSDDALGLKETSFDFGKIPQGKPVTHIFEVVNNGKDSLSISNVVASCGCTTPEWERQKVEAPGEKTKITVGYNAASEGAFTKTITITYNGAQTKQITIKGEVWKTPVTSAPENKELGSLKEK